MTVRQRLLQITSDEGFKTNYGDVLAVGHDAKEREISVWINGHRATLTTEEASLLVSAIRQEIDFAIGSRK